MPLSPDEVEKRFGYHRGTEETIPKHQAIRAKFKEMCRFLDEMLPEGRAKSVAQTELENCSMWANKSVAELASVTDD